MFSKESSLMIREFFLLLSGKVSYNSLGVAPICGNCVIFFERYVVAHTIVSQITQKFVCVGVVGDGGGTRIDFSNTLQGTKHNKQLRRRDV